MSRHAIAEQAADRADLQAVAFVQRGIEQFGSRQSTDEFDVVVAGVRIRIRVAGGALASWMAPALAWRREPVAGAADAELHVLSGAPFGPPPWEASDYDGGRVRGLDSGRVLATFDVQRRILNLFDTVSGQGVLWCDDPARLPEWDLGAPLRTLFSWVLQLHGVHVLHAASVGVGDRGGVLICGRGGSGKSTTTLACVRAGMRTTGDDYCALTVLPTPCVHAVYGMAKVVPASIGGSLVDLTTAHSPRSDGKVHVGLEASLITELPLRAVVLPSVAATTGPLTPIAPRAALHRLAPSTLMQGVIGGAGVLSALGSTLAAVPVYTLPVGPDLDRVVHTIATLLP